jgi:hypothetical protein
MEKIVLEGNNARETLHKRTVECTKIFREVSDWMGIISRCNQTLEDLCVNIQSLLLWVGNSSYRLALRVLSCMQKRPKDSYFLPSS